MTNLAMKTPKTSTAKVRIDEKPSTRWHSRSSSWRQDRPTNGERERRKWGNSSPPTFAPIKEVRGGGLMGLMIGEARSELPKPPTMKGRVAASRRRVFRINGRRHVVKGHTRVISRFPHPRGWDLAEMGLRWVRWEKRVEFHRKWHVTFVLACHKNKWCN